MGNGKSYRVILAPAANSGLAKILKTHGDEAYAEALGDLLDLEGEPAPPHAERMRNAKGYYRIYICAGRYRAVYRVFKGTVLVERIGPRRSINLEGGYVRW